LITILLYLFSSFQGANILNLLDKNDYVTVFFELINLINN